MVTSLLRDFQGGHICKVGTFHWLLFQNIDGFDNPPAIVIAVTTVCRIIRSAAILRHNHTISKISVQAIILWLLKLLTFS